MDLEVRQLEAFAATMRTGSFTAAAAALGIGQPAISQAVRRLEDRVGVVLFQRTGRSVTPTAAAAALLPTAEAALDALGAAQHTAAALAQGSVGSLRLVSTPGSLGVLRGLIDAFSAAYPEARVELVARPARGRREGLRRSEIDVALVRTTQPAPGIAYTRAQRESWRVILACGHPLASTGEPPALAALARWPFASLQDASPALDAYLAAAQAEGSTPQPGPVATTTDDLLALVAGSEAWTLLTAPNAPPPATGLRALRAPAALGYADLWLAHRTDPAPLERALLLLAADRAHRATHSPAN